MANDVQHITISVGALNNGLRPGPKIVSGYGGQTVHGAQIVQSAAGTQAVNLVDLGTAGIAVVGTLATLGSSVYVAGTPKDFTVGGTAYIGEGHYIGVEEINVGTTATVTVVYVQMVEGKSRS